MRMSPIDQPLMPMELLGRRSPAPARDVAHRILGSAWWAGFTFNGITAYGDGQNSLIGGDALLELCRQRLDAFREQRGEEVFAHRSRHRSPISGSVKYRVHRCARGRCECCGTHEQQRALEVDHIVPKNQGGSGDLSNLQASDTLRRSDQNGKVAATSERRISKVSGSMGEGSKPMWR
jgi:hypothetical protein